MPQQLHNKSDEYEVSDAFPDTTILGLRDEVDEAVRKWETKRANQPPTWRWLTKEEEEADERRAS